uniref:HTH psq-type domain-containing protein n=1 Tax=Panagrellus redivivus TaxID=6233 RepID=A0A7E4VK61_PANRE
MAGEGESISLLPRSEKPEVPSSASSFGDDDGVVSESNFSSRGEENSGSMRQVLESVAAIQSQTTYLNHQIAFLLKKFNLSGCECQTCLKESNSTVQKEPSSNGIANVNGSPATGSDDRSFAGFEQHFQNLKRESGESFTNDLTNESMLELFNGAGGNSSIAGPLEFGLREGECRRGRKSKYCNPEQKMLLVDYAQRYGPSAAARKFNIPPAVASYYYRKFNNQRKRGDNGPSPTSLNSPLPRSDNAFDESLTSQGSAPAMPHLSGSPGFLRGRGRGRPKLIGDELDANLVDHMVKIKRQDPRHHLTATAALEHSRDYIRTHAPGLLEEEGGPVNLKHTWAMKLLNRVTEREMELADESNPAALNVGEFPFASPAASKNLMATLNELCSQMNENNNLGAPNDNAENEATPPTGSEYADISEENDLLKVFLATISNAAAAAAQATPSS